MSDQPYNSLGQILASGADLAVSLAMARGWSPDKIGTLISNRFGPLSLNDTNSLLALAARERAAGQAISDDLDSEFSPIDQVPINENIPPERFDDGRVHYIGRVSFDDGENWFEIRVNGTGGESTADIVDEIMEEGERRSSSSPGRFGFGEGMSPRVTNVEIVTTVRRY